jgi:hypothetical protein
MKTMKPKKPFNSSLLLLASLTFTLLTFTLSCENPFVAGLGPVVDFDIPRVTVEPPSGTFIYGDWEFTGIAEDDYKIDSVWFQVTNFWGTETLLDTETDVTRAHLSEATARGAGHASGRTKMEGTNVRWYLKLDTTVFGDNDLKITVRAKDSYGKYSLPVERSYKIKNEGPQITVDVPSISEFSETSSDPLQYGTVGSNYLNYFTRIGNNPPTYAGEGEFPTTNNIVRSIDNKGFITGTLIDREGISGIKGETVNINPPRYRIWKVTSGLTNTSTANNHIPEYNYKTFPSTANVPWKYIRDAEQDGGGFIYSNSSGNYFSPTECSFSLPGPDDPGAFYAFEIQIWSVDVGSRTFRYPQNGWSDPKWAALPTPAGATLAEAQAMNRYALVYINMENDSPEAGLVTKENLSGTYNATTGYPDLPEFLPANANVPHPYVDGVNVNKNGSFTLRVWADHNQGINGAVVYWTKQGTGERGRFIWDTATVNNTNLEPAPITGAYTTWGQRDKHLSTKRYYTFTYNNDTPASNVIPAGALAPAGTPTTATTNPAVPALPTVQQFTGTDSQWAERITNPVNFSVNEQTGTWAANTYTIGTSPTRYYGLGEGTYNLDIYVRSTKLSTSSAYTCSITLDKTAPTVEINRIEDTYVSNLTAASLTAVDPTGVTKPLDPWTVWVNGVIRASVIFSDDGSGLRPATTNTTPNSAYYSGTEQRYVLIADAQKSAWDTAAASFTNNWPQDVTAAVNQINGVTVAKHGAFSAGSALIKTSTLITASPGNDADALADGIYWLYVYTRDNAFNVGKLATPIKLDVKKEYDNPRIDFSVGAISPDVTNPNISADGTANGFKLTADGSPRNKLGPSSYIRMNLLDDDGLDLGFGTPNATGVTISFVGSELAANGTIQEKTVAGAVMTFTAAEIREGTPNTPSLNITATPPIFAPATAAKVKRQLGTITQKHLLYKLKSNSVYSSLFPGGASAYTDEFLPDGMYKITIGIQDRPADKLTNAGTPVVANNAPVVSFWVVVDSTPPDFVIDETATTPSGGFVPGGVTAAVTIKGDVSDANGPITLAWKVFRGTNQTTPVYQEGPTELTREAPPFTDTTKWKAPFEVTRVLGDVSDSFRFELTFTDRFGASKTQSWNYQSDNTAPLWDFTSPMAKNENTTTGNIIPADISNPAIGYWWRTDATPADWNNLKRTWLNGRVQGGVSQIPVINTSGEKPTLSGTFTDLASDIDPATFKYKIDGGTEQNGTINGTGKSVRWSINLTDNGLTSGNALSDGVHTVQITVADTTQNVLPMTGMYAFRIDSAQPEVKIDSITPTSANGTRDTSIVIKGTASDANLNTVTLRYRINGSTGNWTEVNLNATPAPTGVTLQTRTFEYPPAPTAPQPPQPPLTETLTWTYTLTVGTGANNPTAGIYDVTLTATDYSNKSPAEPATGTFIIDRTAPVIAFDSLVTSATGTANTLTPATIVIPGGTGTVNGNVINSATQPVRGTVTEANTIATMQTRIERWNWGRSADPGELDSAPAAWVVYTGEDWATLSPSANWSKSLADIANFADGLYRMQVRATDAAGNTGTSAYMYFYRDTTPVTLLADSLNSYYSLTASGTLIFKGSVANPNRFRSVTAKVDLGTNTRPTGWPNASAWPPEGVWAPNPLTTGMAAQNWNINVTVPQSTAYDGTRSVTFTAINMAGRPQEITLPLNLDSTPPELAITTPRLRNSGDAGTDNAPVSTRPYASINLNGAVDEILAGTSADPGANASGLTGLWYRIGVINGAMPTTQAQIEARIKSELDPKTGDNYTEKAQAAVADPNSLWFELGGTKPQGFVISSSNMHDWRITVPNLLDLNNNGTIGEGEELGGLTQFARAIAAGTLKTGSPAYAAGALVTATNNTKYVSLPLWVFSTDRAGNTQYILREIWFNPDADTPNLTITNPTAGSTGGGSIIAQGTADSVSSIYAIVYRVKSGGAPAANPPSGLSNVEERVETVSGARSLTEGGRAGLAASLTTNLGAAFVGDTTKWYLASNEAGWGQNNIPFNFIVNGANEITNRLGSFTTIMVTLEVYAFSGTTGPNKPATAVETRVFYIKNTAPSIGTLQISRTGGTATGDFVNVTDNNRVVGGTFAVRAPLSAGSGQALSRIEVRRTEESSNWITVWPTDHVDYVNTPGISVNNATNPTQLTFRLNSTADSNQNNNPNSPNPPTTTVGYSMVKPINNNGVIVGGWKESGGKYPIEIRITDNAALRGTATATFNLGIDNFAPVADTSPGANTPKKRAGQAEEFFGRVFDYTVDKTANVAEAPSERGIRKIDVWFTRLHGANPGRYIHPDTGVESTLTTAGGNSATLENQSAFRNREPTIVYTLNDPKADVTKIAFASNDAKGIVSDDIPVPRGTAAAHVKTIDSTTGAPGVDTGLRWMATTAEAYDVSWSVTLDTTKIADGWVRVHYIVEDKMGNRSYYTQDTIIRNKAPQITAVTLYTDNRGLGAQFTSDESQRYVIDTYKTHMTSGYLNSGFIVKNNTLIFGVETLQGNNEKNFQVQYVTRTEIQLTDTNMAQMRTDKTAGGINVYTIASQGGYTASDWAALGLIYTGDGNPPNGTHFIYNGATVVTEKLATVWKYSLVGASPNALERKVGPRDLLIANPDPHNVIPRTVNGVTVDDTLKFTAAGDYGTGRIVERKNSIPPSTAPNYDPPYTVSHTEPTNVFLVRVWDRVDLTDDEPNEQLHDTVVVDMNIYLTDTVTPIGTFYDLNPATETAVSTNTNTTIANALNPRAMGQNEGRGGLYNASGNNNVLRRSGHIEPRSASTKNVTGNTYSVGQDEVSGTVILRGKAWDDQLIRSVSLTIGGTDIPLLTLNAATRMLEPVPASGVSKFEKMDWRDGHTVEWAYLWNTETTYLTPTTTAVTIIVNVRDDKGGSGTPPVGNTNATDTVARSYPSSATTNKGVLVKPFVYGFTRDAASATPKYAAKRSRQGWYSFFQGEQNIAILGYNLGVAGTANTSVTIYDGSALSASLIQSPTHINVSGVARPVFTVGTSQKSGRINLTVNNIAATNNAVDVAQAWNQDYHRFTDGSDVWDSKLYAHIWRTAEAAGDMPTYFGTLNDTNGMEGPSMALEYGASGNAGRLHGSWGIRSTFNVFYGVNDGTTARVELQRSNDPLVFTDIDYYPGTTNSRNRTVTAVYQWDGQPAVFINTSMFPAGFNGGSLLRPSLMEAIGTDTYRWNNPRIRMTKPNLNSGGSTDATSNGWDPNNQVNGRNRGRAGRVYASVYDSINQSLGYAARVDNISYPNVNNQGNTSIGDTNTTAGNYLPRYIDGSGAGAIKNNNDWGNVGTGATGNSTSQRAGLWSAVDYIRTGNGEDAVTPVIAYYDETNETLRLAYGDTNNSSAINEWNRRYVLRNTHALFRGSGQYVSMKIDKNNGIHLAFYNATYKTLVYAYSRDNSTNTELPVADRLPSYRSDFTAYTIDNLDSGSGTWTDISLDDDGNPWIVYGDTGRSGNYDAIRIAYRNTTANNGLKSWNDPVTEAAVTGWEALTMPAAYTVSDDRLNIEVWPPNNRSGATLGTRAPALTWDAAIGYSGTDNTTRKFRIGYFFKPGVKPGE